MDDLLVLNKKGFIPGPLEEEGEFLKRVELTEKLYINGKKFFEKEGVNPPFSLDDPVIKPDLSWVQPTLFHLFDISAEKFSAYFSNHELRFFQGAATWFLDEKSKIAILQLRKRLKKGQFLGIYELEDVLAHELTHFARAGFDEKIFEEFFAYLTSSRFVRKVFGPIFSSAKEVFIFFSFLGASLISQYLLIFFESRILNFLFLTSSIFSITLICFGFSRLGIRKLVFNRCYKNLLKVLKSKKRAMAVMFRLTDSEIKAFSKRKFDILDYVEKNKDNTLRWKVIYAAYFY